MTGPAGAVGQFNYPIVPGPQDSAIRDPLLEGLCTFAGTVLAADINAVLANISGTSAVAVGPGNVFYWNPFARPHAMFLRGKQDGAPTSGLPAWAPFTSFAEGTIATIGTQLVLCTTGGTTGSGPGPVGQGNVQPDGSAVWAFWGPIAAGVPRVPALFCWRESSKTGDWSTLLDTRESIVMLAWVWNQLLLPGAWEDRYGIFGAVDGSLQRAFSIGHHPAVQADSSISVLLGLCKDGVYCQGSSFQLIGPIVGPGGSGDQPATRGFPAVVLKIHVDEPISQPLQAPSEQPGDLPVTIRVVDDTQPGGALVVLDGVVPAAPLETDT